jgi:hypothetical protein
VVGGKGNDRGADAILYGESQWSVETCNNGLLRENPDILNNLLMTDEARFHLSGFVNKQNMRYWSPVNPKGLHEMPLYSHKVTVCCGVGAFEIVGPNFFENDNEGTVTVNSERYVTMLECFVEPQLRRLVQPFIFSRMEQQPTPRETVWLLFVKCSELLSLASPARSPDLTLPHFFL